MTEPEVVRGVPNFPDVRVVTPEEAEQCDFVVCMRDEPGIPRAPLAANFGQCSECQHPIYWANSAPKTVRKVCVQCGARMAKRLGADS